MKVCRQAGVGSKSPKSALNPNFHVTESDVTLHFQRCDILMFWLYSLRYSYKNKVINKVHFGNKVLAVKRFALCCKTWLNTGAYVYLS